MPITARIRVLAPSLCHAMLLSPVAAVVSIIEYALMVVAYLEVESRSQDNTQLLEKATLKSQP